MAPAKQQDIISLLTSDEEDNSSDDDDDLAVVVVQAAAAAARPKSSHGRQQQRQRTVSQPDAAASSSSATAASAASKVKKERLSSAAAKAKSTMAFIGSSKKATTAATTTKSRENSKMNINNNNNNNNDSNDDSSLDPPPLRPADTSGSFSSSSSSSSSSLFNLSSYPSHRKKITPPPPPPATSTAVATALATGTPGSSSEDDSDNDSDDSDLNSDIRRIAALQKQCWSPHCQCDLRATKESESLLYAMHAHPLLSGVPTCSVCAEEVDAIEQQRLEKLENTSNGNNNKNDESSSDDEDEEDFCAGCAIGDSSGELLFLCDNNNKNHGDENEAACCGRAFCQSCLAQAYGGGAKGWKATQKLAAQADDDDDEVWKCPVCEPTETLQSIASAMALPKTPHESPEFSKNGDAANQEQQQQQQQRRGTAQQVFDKILAIEEERQRTIELLDSEADKLAEIRDELQSEGSFNDQDDDGLEEAALEEVAEWKDQLLKHDRRLVDLLTALQDDFQHIHKMDLQHAYEQAGLVVRAPEKDDNESGVDESSDDDEEDDDPDWVHRANIAIDKRHKKEAKKQGPTQPQLSFSAQKRQEVECYQDVEVLADLEQGDSTVLAKGFEGRMDGQIMSDKDWAELEQMEADYLAHKNIKPRIDSKPKTDADDVEETRNEEEQQTRPGGDGIGISRIITRTRPTTTLQVRRRDRSNATSTHPNADQKPAAAPSKKEDQAEPPSAATVGTPSGSKSFQRGATPGSSTSSSMSGKVWATPSKGKVKHETGSVSYDSTPGSQRKLRPSTISDLRLCKWGSVFHSTVAVDPQLAKHLKPHQREGVEFMFKNSFIDLVQKNGYQSEIGGCVVAHHMGLGKSLSAIALIHTLLTHHNNLITTVLLCVPVNTIANWKEEFDKWTSNIRGVLVHDISDVNTNKNARQGFMDTWKRFGGVLIISPELLARMKGTGETLNNADCLFIDEGHLCLKTATTAIYKRLQEIKTPRRLVLTGTPLSNDILEYYNVVNYVRPGLLGSESEFEVSFKAPITAGMASDCSDHAALESRVKSAELYKKLEFIVHRKDVSVLQSTLPPLQQVVLHVRPTRLQSQIYNKYKKHQQKLDSKNFFRAFQALRPINNHPGSIVTMDDDKNRESGAKKSASADEEDEKDFYCPDNKQFHERIRGGAMRDQDEHLLSVENGSKVVLLLHILAQAQRDKEKVLIFSCCLRTLDYLEKVLAYPNWKEHVESLAGSFPDFEFGGWEKGQDFYRMDGGTNASDRGDMVTKFNSDGSRAFLLAMRAGGIGTNLVAATRVVLMDTHFNPSISEQAIHRCYRYGQKKPVFVYRMLTVGTVEEKVYARTVTKTGVACRVVDNKTIERYFTAREISDLQTTDTWVLCDHCGKWRMLVGGDATEKDDLPDKWYCDMNSDKENNTCDAAQKDDVWYFHRHDRQEAAEALASLCGTGAPPTAKTSKSRDSAETSLSKEATQALVDKDSVVKHLLTLTGSKKSALVSKHYFHEGLMQLQDVEEPKMEQARGPSAEQHGDSKIAAVDKQAFGSDSKKKKRARLESASTKVAKQPRSESPKSKSKHTEDDSVELKSTLASSSSNGKKRAKSLPPTGQGNAKRKASTPKKYVAKSPGPVGSNNSRKKSPVRDLFHENLTCESTRTASRSTGKNPSGGAQSPAAAAALPSRRSPTPRKQSRSSKEGKNEPTSGGKEKTEEVIDGSDSPSGAEKPSKKKPSSNDLIDLCDDDSDDEAKSPHQYEWSV